MCDHFFDSLIMYTGWCFVDSIEGLHKKNTKTKQMASVLLNISKYRKHVFKPQDLNCKNSETVLLNCLNVIQKFFSVVILNIECV